MGWHVRKVKLFFRVFVNEADDLKIVLLQFLVGAAAMVFVCFAGDMDLLDSLFFGSVFMLVSFGVYFALVLWVSISQYKILLKQEENDLEFSYVSGDD